MSNSMDDLLKMPVDEVEETPDQTMKPEAEAATPAAEPKADPKPEATTTTTEKPEAAAAPPEGETEEARTKRMHALPKWAHERMRANDEKTAAAERRLADLAREADELRKNNEAWVKWHQEQTGEAQPEETRQPQFDPAQQTRAAIYETRLALGLDRANEKFGPEYTDQASHWASDRMKTDRHFWEGMMNAPDPVGYAIKEFRKAQTESELEKYGWDLDALAKARAPQPQPAQAPTQVQQTNQPAAGDKGASRNPLTSQPSDFASTPSAQGRQAPVWAGPRPLGDLLKTPRGQ